MTQKFDLDRGLFDGSRPKRRAPKSRWKSRFQRDGGGALALKVYPIIAGAFEIRLKEVWFPKPGHSSKHGGQVSPYEIIGFLDNDPSRVRVRAIDTGVQRTILVNGTLYQNYERRAVHSEKSEEVEVRAPSSIEERVATALERIVVLLEKQLGDGE